MEDWDLTKLAWKPHRPEILSSADDRRAVVIDLPAGELLQDHQVHESALITVIDGEVTITSQTGQSIDAKPGVVVQIAAQERHEVTALTDSRLLLLLTPWPGAGHPGAMTLQQKTDVRERAAQRAG
jgi:quercetin dioxygenase-like cupin family protein